MTVEENNIRPGLDIAVIGMSGQFPGAKDIHQFWENLKNGIETIAFFSDHELEEAGGIPERFNIPNYVKAKPVLEKIEYFDAAFFGYLPWEAEKMDPQMRFFHQYVWHGLEDAGYNPDTYNGAIGLYGGATNNSLWEIKAWLSEVGSAADYLSTTQLSNKDHMNSRISYKLNLTGPTFVMETQCSTSLVAVHLACQGLLSGECDLALAGGVTLTAPQISGYRCQEGVILSPDGHCRPFDAKANGTLFGNGAAVVVLKRIEDATADRDHIYAVIKGTAINNDGNRKAGYTAPSVEGQADVIRTAHQVSQVEPESITYIETHGTGTTLGDPIEIEALKLAFNTDKKGFCRIGSVKGNMGHLDNAAGVTGLIKAVLALNHRLIPPSIHFETPNPKIDFENSPFVVNRRLTPWESNGGPRRAGVSSFGIGGTNAHVVLEEWSDDPSSNARRTAHSARREYQLIVLSAKTETALEKMTENLAGYFKKNLLNHGNDENPVNPGPTLADAAYTLQTGRKAFNCRRALVCSHIREAINTLEDPGSGNIQILPPGDTKPTVVFMFSGQGAQYKNMGLELYRTEPVFQKEMDRGLAVLESLMGPVRHILYPALVDGIRPGTVPADKENHQDKIHHVFYSGPLKFIFDYSMAKLLMKWGIKPHVMIGHSFGEYVAACLSGVFSLEDALNLVVLRGQLMFKTPEGGMLGVPLSEEKVKSYLTRYHKLSLAAVNTASLCIVSGPEAEVERFNSQLAKEGYECIRINFPRASHSKMMEPILREFEEKVGRVTLNEPQIPYISCVTGELITAEQVTRPGYWAAHMRETVRFADGIDRLIETPNAIFIQVGAGRGLTLYVNQHPGKKTSHLVTDVLRSRKEDVPDVRYLLNKIGDLWLWGQNIDWKEFHEGQNRYRISLPLYWFETRRFWKYGGDFLKDNMNNMLAPSQIKKKKDISDWFYIPCWKPSDWPAGRQDQGENPAQSCWLVFIDKCGLGTKLVQRLERENRQVISVIPGAGFAEMKNNVFTLNPRRDDDFDTLIDKLGALKMNPDKIIHLWGVTEAEDCEKELDPTRVDRLQDLGLHSLINIARAMGKQDIKNGITIGVVTNNMRQLPGEGVLSPGKATVIGPVRTIPNEFPGMRCFSVDIVVPEPGSEQETRLLRRLISEFPAPPSQPVQCIAFRGNNRLVETLEPVRFQQLNPGKPPDRLKEKGVYLVIGGLGGVGLVFAQYLARTVRARLILVGRSPLPPRKDWGKYSRKNSSEENDISLKIREIEELESLGASVLVFDADVSNPGRMQQVIARSEAQLGRINGVIHSAMVVDGAVIARRTRQKTGSVISAKVMGTLVLDRIFKDRKLDFFVLFSSTAAYTGTIGEVAYCAACAFQDAYARYRDNSGATFTVSINWDAWQEVGQAVKAAQRLAQNYNTGFKAILQDAILPREGIEIFEQVIQREFPQVAISKKDLQLLSLGQNKPAGVHEASTGREPRETPTPADKKTLYKRPKLKTEYAAPVTAHEKKLAEIWQTFFGIEQVGILDDFFELGGDSLKAMVVISKIQKELKVRIPLAVYFECANIKLIAQYIEKDDHQPKDDDAEGKPVEKREYYPLSSAQKRLFVLWRMDKESLGYNEITAALVEGGLKINRLEQVFKQLIARHESLRTSFEMINDQSVQRVHEEVKFKIEYDDLYRARVEEEEQEAENRGRDTEGKSAAHPSSDLRHLSSQFIRPFDLSEPPLIRVAVIKTAAETYILLVDMPHIITDGASLDIFVKELMALYAGEKPNPTNLQYKDYAMWKNSEKEKQKETRQRKFWINQFKEEIPVLDLINDYQRPALINFSGKTIDFVITGEDTGKLRTLAAKEDITIYMLFLAVYYVLLSKLSGQEDIVVGTVVAGRNYQNLENILGMFVNTLAMRNYPSGKKTFKEFLKELKKNTLDAFDNQDYPFENLVETITGERDPGRNPVFDVVFTFQDAEGVRVEGAGTREITIPGLKLKPYNFEKQISKFDMSFHGYDRGESILFNVEYRSTLFKKETIERFARYFKRVTASILKDINRQLAVVDIMTEEEKQRVLEVFNRTAAGYPHHKTIHRLFAEQVERSPEHIAAAGRCALTYRELDEQSHRLAHLLQEKGVVPDTIVAIMAPRCVETVTGILGILKAGGAYLPIDPDYPEERKQYMLKDSGAEILLTRQEIAGLSSPEAFNNSPKGTPSFGIWNLEFGISPQKGGHLAYIIYTSGTTGKPKGVMIRHGNVVRLLFNKEFQFDFDDSDVWTMFHSFCFDFSVWEMYGALLYGGKLVIIPKETTRDPRGFRSLLERNGVTVLNQTPSAFYNLMNEELSHETGELGLRYVIFGGEALNPGKLGKWKEKYPGTRLINMYGITETTVHVTFKEIGPADLKSSASNIGGPIPTVSIYVVDRNMKLAPIGVVGELCVGGEGVGRGYLNRVELTAEKFDRDLWDYQDYHDRNHRSYRSYPSYILYKSGDLVKINGNWEIEYVARMDQQVQIRGFRVEPGEIQGQLLLHDEIKEAVVAALEEPGGTRSLCAYIVSKKNQPPAVSQLREYLSRRLPVYMIPSYFVPLDKIPLTPNGKVDRKSLPRPGEFRAGLDKIYVAPDSTMEKTIAAIWNQVLDREKTGIHDNFFEIGGNSLNIVQVNTKLSKACEKEIPIPVQFQYPTIHSLAQFLDRRQSTRPDRKKRSRALNKGKMDKQQRYQKRKKRH